MARLNGGWRIALVRMGCQQPTKEYVARRTAEGRTKTAIMRCLKRYIAREVFPHQKIFNSRCRAAWLKAEPGSGEAAFDEAGWYWIFRRPCLMTWSRRA